MKQYTETINGDFVDFAGKKHYFTIVAISQTNDEYYVGDNDDTFEEDINKVVRIGYSICNPTDEYNPEYGEKVAVSRALSSKPVMFVTNSGLINTTMIQGLLKQEAKYIENNPEKYIKGYFDAKAKYLKDIEMNDLKDCFSSEELAILDKLKNNPSYLDDINTYFDWWCRKQGE